jgi:hypothetical protein
MTMSLAFEIPAAPLALMFRFNLRPYLIPFLHFLGWFGIAAGVFIIIAMLRAAWGWSKIARLRTPMSFRRYLRLRWGGVNVLAVAAADWAARVSGWDVDLELWVSFAVLRVDVVRLAAALAWAKEHHVETTIGALGAAALAGYDPLDVAQAAFARELGTFTNDDLTQLDTWKLERGKKPA